MALIPFSISFFLFSFCFAFIFFYFFVDFLIWDCNVIFYLLGLSWLKPPVNLFIICYQLKITAYLL